MVDFSFDFSSLEFNFEPLEKEEDKAGDFIRAAKYRPCKVEYNNAIKLAEDIDISQDYFGILGGQFIYGDFIEALCDVWDLKPDRIRITTLGMGSNNIDSIVNIMDYLECKSLDLVVSNYFAAVERRNLMPYMISEFSGRNIRVGVCASHTKITVIESAKANLTIFGSANLSSSNNLEEFALTHDDSIRAYCNKVIDGIMKDFTIIDSLINKTIFENNQGNTSRTMFEKVKEYLED